jgi:DNA primase
MAGISPATIERIRAASDIVDVIGMYLPLKKAGANFTALCPFHKEKTPSFNVNAHKQIFHCFGCHKGGDVFTFVKEYENIGFVDAVRRLAERAKIPLKFDNNPTEQQSRHLKDQLLEIHEQITQRWQNCLANEAAGQMARDYLAKRGVSAEAIKLFRLGAAPESWDDTVNWAKSKNHELPLIEKAGLIIHKEETGNYYDRFRGRLMFPICDEQGRVIGFSGRILSGDEKTAKYVNSPETPIFTKGKVFFGLDKAKRAILDVEEAIICEGQIDLIACHMAGVKNVVAPQGTALTVDHARILQRYTDLIVLCFDADQAGWKAAIKAFDPRIAAKLSVLVAIVPAPHDPDSFIKTFGTDAFRKLISDAQSFFDFYLNYLSANNNVTTDQGRITIASLMIEALQKTDNAVQIDKYIQKTALRLGVSPEAVRKEFSKFKFQSLKSGVQESDETLDAEPQTLNQSSSHEFHLLKLLLLHDDLVAWAALHLDVNWILHPHVRQIVSQRLAAQTNETWQSLGAFLDALDSAEMRNLVTEAVAEERKIPNPETQLADVTLKLRSQFLDRHITALTQRVSQPEISESDKIELLHEQQKLRDQKRAPLSPLPN